MADSAVELSNSVADKAEYIGGKFGFLVPLLIPWMQELCTESATFSMRMLYELPETTIPYQLIPKTSLKFETIRDSIIPQLFKFINSTPDPNKYLIDRFNYYYIQQIQNMEDEQEDDIDDFDDILSNNNDDIKEQTSNVNYSSDDSHSSSSSSSSSDSSDSSSISSSKERKREGKRAKKRLKKEKTKEKKIINGTMNKQRRLSDRRLELYISSLISDLITYAHYQRQNMNNNNNNNNNDTTSTILESEFLNNMLPLELSMIIQYIKMLIWEYHESILMINENNNKKFKLGYKYDEILCCESLLTILNHEYTHQLLIEKIHRNISDFGMFAEYLHENVKELSNLKKINQDYQTEIIKLKNEINDIKKKDNIISTRPSSQSVPQRGEKIQEKKIESPPLPIIERIDIETHIEEKEIILPPQSLQESMWQPLAEMYELFEPRQKNRKKFQRIREEEEIPPAPNRGPPPLLKKKKSAPPKSSKHPIKYKDKSKIVKKPKPLSKPPMIAPKSKSLDPNYKISIENDNDENINKQQQFKNKNTLTPTNSVTTPTNFDEYDGNNINIAIIDDNIIDDNIIDDNDNKNNLTIKNINKSNQHRRKKKKKHQ